MSRSRRAWSQQRSRRDLDWTPFENMGDGAGGEPNKATHVNTLYQVSTYEYPSGWTWLAIVRRDRSAVHDWRHFQRIKNELCGPEREAVEIFPAESRLVDTSNQWHLWVGPEGWQMPIGYAARDITTETWGAHKQRPFDVTPDDADAMPIGTRDQAHAQTPMLGDGDRFFDRDGDDTP